MLTDHSLCVKFHTRHSLQAIPQTQGKRPLTSSQEDFLVVLFPSAEDKIASDLVHQVADQVWHNKSAASKLTNPTDFH